MQSEKRKPRGSKSKKKAKNREETSILQEPEPIVAPSAPPSIGEEEIKREIEAVSLLEVEDTGNHISIVNSEENLKYPALFGLMTTEKNNESNGTEIKTDTNQQIHTQKSTKITNGFVFEATNSHCIQCSETFGNDAVILSSCGHAEHAMCCEEKISQVIEKKVCSVCIGYNIKPQEQKKEQSIEEEEDLCEKIKRPEYKIDNGNDPDARKMNERLMRKKRIKDPLEFIDYEIISSAIGEQEEPELNIAKKKAAIEKPEDYEIEISKIYDLLKKKGVIKVSGLRGAWDTFKSTWGGGEIGNYLDQNTSQLSHNFLVKNKVTLDDLHKNGFNMDDLYWGIGATTMLELKQLGLAERHFESQNIINDFETFIERYSPNVHELDAIMTVHLDWLREVCEDDPKVMKQLEIDFQYLVETLALDKEDFHDLSWSIDQCLLLGMEVKHLIGLEFNAEDFIKLGWDFNEMAQKFGLNERQQHKMGITKDIKKIVESSKSSKSEKSRRKDCNNV